MKFISRINNTQGDDAHNFHVVMSMYNLIEYSENYLKRFRILFQFYRYVSAIDNYEAIVDFNEDNVTTRSFSIKVKITGQTSDSSTKYVKTMTALKHLCNVWRTLEMPLISCKINFDLNWSRNCYSS